MGLYHNIMHFDYDINTYDPVNYSDHVAWIRNPFLEYQLDPIFKVTALYDDYTFDLECIQSTFLPIGTIYLKQSRREFRRVKLTPIGSNLQYIKTI